MSNAIKFTPKKGEITISARVVSSEDSNKKIEISVKDSGIGIPQEKIIKLFDIDNNYSSPGTSEEIGTGLGLILCKEFIEKCEGNIWVESEIGKGSNFKILVPDILCINK